MIDEESDDWRENSNLEENFDDSEVGNVVVAFEQLGIGT
jgi:hypothetical protein